MPDDVIEGRRSLASVQISRFIAPPEFFKGEANAPDTMPLPVFLEKTGCLQLPAPSISPIFASGALVFLTPAVTRDLPEMVTQCRRRGFRVGFGTIIVSKHLERFVASVLRITEAMHHTGSFIKIKSRATVESPHPCAPAGCFRYQGLTSSRGLARATAPRYFEEPRPFTGGDTDSMETRQTRSTGDLTTHPSPNRLSACDRRYRQPLRGNVRAHGFFRHRRELVLPNRLNTHSTSSWLSSLSSQQPSLLNFQARKAKEDPSDGLASIRENKARKATELQPQLWKPYCGNISRLRLRQRDRIRKSERDDKYWFI